MDVIDTNNIYISIDSIVSNISNNNYIYIYTIYRTINDSINSIRDSLYDNTNKLDILIKQNGPQDVKAQIYDKTSKGGSLKMVAINDLIQEINSLKLSIDSLRIELDISEETKRNFYKSIIGAYSELEKSGNVDTEFTVFVQRFIRKKTLFEIAEVTRYNYSYIRQVAGDIQNKMKLDKNT